jgi:hypothetical protein
MNAHEMARTFSRASKLTAISRTDAGEKELAAENWTGR